MDPAQPNNKQVLSSLNRLQKIILDTVDFNQVVQKIIDGSAAELDELGLNYRNIVFLTADEKARQLKRDTVSQTPVSGAVMGSTIYTFEGLVLSLAAKDNFCVQVYFDQKWRLTKNWKDILSPFMDEQEATNLQSVSGVKSTLIVPVMMRNICAGVLVFCLGNDIDTVTGAEEDLIRGIAVVLSLALHDVMLYAEVESNAKQLVEANDRLHELDQLKSEFVSVASHELRTPMTAIKSYLWMAIAGRGGQITDKEKYYLERAYNSTDRLIKLVNDLLNVSRIESGKLTLDSQKISIGQFVDEVISEIKPHADEMGVAIRNEFDQAKPFEVLADPDKIKEVLMNLLGNSLKFTPQGGLIRIWYSSENNQVTTHVTDNGEGIDSLELPKLFQKFGLVKDSFVTNQKAAQGTGLGLYISRSLVELHGGKMWAESLGKGQGATLSFSLPIFTEEAFQSVRENKSAAGVGIIHSSLD